MMLRDAWAEFVLFVLGFGPRDWEDAVEREEVSEVFGPNRKNRAVFG